jgi:hypothetical protein
MRVVVQLESGPLAGRTILLRAGQRLQIGRTALAEFAVPDNLMSSVHFAIETDSFACCVTDLGSRNGTDVNGRRIVQKIRLCDGDRIRAGETVFLIQIEDAWPMGADTTATSPMSSLDLAQRPGSHAAGQPAVARYTVERCDSGLTLCRGETAELPPSELARQLGQLYPACLLVDFHKLGRPPPAELTAPDYLFDWLGPQVAAGISPVVIAQHELPGWASLIETGWDGDAVVCLFSKQQKPALLEHLRHMSQANIHPRASGPVSLLGYCWPSVMAPLLLSFRPEFVEKLLTGIEAVLVEFPDLPSTWQLFGRGTQLAADLDRLGLVRQAEQSAAPKPAGPKP